MENFWKEELIKDDLLRMMFACCHPGNFKRKSNYINAENTLRISVPQKLPKHFLQQKKQFPKDCISTKEFFRQHKIKLVIPSVDEIKKRTDAVLNTIYLLFNEGYNSTSSEELIRKDVIEEAMMLCKLLTENDHTQQPEVFALMALMCFHSSRSESRLTTEGEIILLPMQDRKKWNTTLINEGNEYMNKAAFGDAVSAYHIEAAIAYEHCSAKVFKDTNWKRIVEYYEWLCRISPSPINDLNKTVAVMELYGAAIALQELESIKDKK